MHLALEVAVVLAPMVRDVELEHRTPGLERLHPRIQVGQVPVFFFR